MGGRVGARVGTTAKCQKGFSLSICPPSQSDGDPTWYFVVFADAKVPGGFADLTVAVDTATWSVQEVEMKELAL